ncbi:MAG: monovalent cation/H(+) antiporter subunit G [Planctomycetota bacterium]|nr:monovalent cation/H(+) antiporter subunit G [Planctomycetota bacterium]
MNGFDGFTLRALLDLLAAIFLAFGLFFMFVGAIGVVRLPDGFNRIHAASMCVTLGLTGMLIAACYHIADGPMVTKAVATIVFILVATPIGSHLLAKAAHHGRMPLWDRTLSDELAEDKLDPRRSASDELDSSGQSSSPNLEPEAASTQKREPTRRRNGDPDMQAA